MLEFRQLEMRYISPLSYQIGVNLFPSSRQQRDIRAGPYSLPFLFSSSLPAHIPLCPTMPLVPWIYHAIHVTHLLVEW